MDIRVSGHQIETGEALQSHVSDRLDGAVGKYFPRAISSQVTFGKAAGAAFAADIVTHVSQGMILKARGEAHDIRQAFETALGKIEKQLRRYKRRLTDRHAQAEPSTLQEEAAYTVFAGIENDSDEDEAQGADAPPVIAETRVDIPEGSVADAVMMLDLRDTNALFFKNAVTGRHNMVYRRNDGSIGWVEPH